MSEQFVPPEVRKIEIQSEIEKVKSTLKKLEDDLALTTYYSQGTPDSFDISARHQSELDQKIRFEKEKLQKLEQELGSL